MEKLLISYAEFVSMRESEFKKLILEYGEFNTRKCIEILDNYKGATGRKYKSDYRAILMWVVDCAKRKGVLCQKPVNRETYTHTPDPRETMTPEEIAENKRMINETIMKIGTQLSVVK